MILDTVSELLAAVSDMPNVQIILSYRSPRDLQVEEELRAVALRHPSLCLLNVTTGNGKAEQLNQAIDRATGEVVYLLDADAMPDRWTIRRVPFILSEQVDVVQGRNMIRNTGHLIGKIVAVEFAAKYMVSHLARSRLAALAYFCGSNCIWRLGVARATRFSNASLVEDVEASVRADLNGSKIVIDPTFATTELAPECLVDWWRQRRRWAQGWLEVGRLHTAAICSQSRFSLWKKVNWIYVIYGRRVGYALMSFGLLGTSLLLLLGGDGRGAVFLGSFVVVQLMTGITQAGAVAVQASRLGEKRLPLSWCLVYGFTYPLYDVLKNAVTIAAIAASVVGIRDWRITPRRRPACLEEQ